MLLHFIIMYTERPLKIQIFISTINYSLNVKGSSVRRYFFFNYKMIYGWIKFIVETKKVLINHYREDESYLNIIQLTGKPLTALLVPTRFPNSSRTIIIPPPPGATEDHNYPPSPWCYQSMISFALYTWKLSYWPKGYSCCTRMNVWLNSCAKINNTQKADAVFDKSWAAIKRAVVLSLHDNLSSCFACSFFICLFFFSNTALGSHSKARPIKMDHSQIPEAFQNSPWRILLQWSYSDGSWISQCLIIFQIGPSDSR